MNVEPAIQATLLRLAEIDTELTRIAHRRTVLPEQQEVDRLTTERNTYKDSAIAVEIAAEDLDRDIKKLESEIDAVTRREERDRAIQTAGSVGAKQLTEIAHELTSLARRRSTLEDELLEVMERREATAADHDHAGARLSKAEEDLAVAERACDEAQQDLAVAEQRCRTDRAGLIDTFPAELLAIYDQQRAEHGFGAALLRARRCGACRIEIDRGEIARIAKTPAEVVVQCPECGAIMVRTHESGL